MALNEQQRYLMSRIPDLYRFHRKLDKEPAAIKKARKMVQGWDGLQADLNKTAEARAKEFRALCQEAVHFKPAGVALEMIKDFEQRIKKGTI